MISIRIYIQNLWRKENFKSFFVKNLKLTKNKSFEFQITRYTLDLFLFELSLAWYGHDHAGPFFILSLFGYSLNIKIYDNRHWDYDTNTWELYNESNC